MASVGQIVGLCCRSSVGVGAGPVCQATLPLMVWTFRVPAVPFAW